MKTVAKTWMCSLCGRVMLMGEEWDGFTLVQRTLSWTSVGQVLGPDLPLNDLR